jgi:osomolarity two-component system phosphorelay intermediate protein YPD1
VGLAQLGHFLKGSSATLGLINVRDCCEKIQNFGGKKDATGARDMLDGDKCLTAIDEALKSMREEYVKAEGYFKRRYPLLQE